MSSEADNLRDMAYKIRCLYDDFVEDGTDLDTSLFADDFTWEAAENTAPFEGSPHKGARAFLRNVYWNQPEWEQCGFRVDQMTTGDRIVLQGYYLGIYKPTGRLLCAQMLHIWTVEDGKVTRLQELTDSQEFHEVTSA